MKTGKKASKHYAKLIEYVPIWTLHILNNDDGYSIQRAYDINPLFGQLVERSVILSEIDNDTIEMLRRNHQIIMAKLLMDYSKARDRLLKAINKYQKGKADDSEVKEAHNEWFWNILKTLHYSQRFSEMTEDEMNQWSETLERWDKIDINPEFTERLGKLLIAFLEQLNKNK